MKVKVISVALNGDDDARQGGRVGGDFLKHLLEGLPGGFAEQAEFLGVVYRKMGRRSFGMVNPNWLWFTAFVGANLFQSSLTQWCLMENILVKLGVGKGK